MDDMVGKYSEADCPHDDSEGPISYVGQRLVLNGGLFENRANHPQQQVSDGSNNKFEDRVDYKFKDYAEQPQDKFFHGKEPNWVLYSYPGHPYSNDVRKRALFRASAQTLNFL